MADKKMNQSSNPFHQYDTRYKPSLPQRTNAAVPWQQQSYVPPSYTPPATTVTTASPLYFSNGQAVSGQQWWGSFKR